VSNVSRQTLSTTYYIIPAAPQFIAPMDVSVKGPDKGSPILACKIVRFQFGVNVCPSIAGIYFAGSIEIWSEVNYAEILAAKLADIIHKKAMEHNLPC